MQSKLIRLLFIATIYCVHTQKAQITYDYVRRWSTPSNTNFPSPNFPNTLFPVTLIDQKYRLLLNSTSFKQLSIVNKQIVIYSVYEINGSRDRSLTQSLRSLQHRFNVLEQLVRNLSTSTDRQWSSMNNHWKKLEEKVS